VAKTNVMEFNVRGTDLSGGGARDVAACLSNSKVDMLHMSNNNLTSGTSIVKTIEREIGSLIQSRGTVLDLSGRDIGDLGLWLLSSSMKRMTSVRKINVSNCGLGPEGAKTLGAILTSLPQVESVIAAFNAFGDAGAEIARGLEESDIIELNLRGTGMTSAGARAVAEALSTTDVETLNLSDNKIDESAVAGIAALVRVGSVETLKLSGNKIGDAEALAVLACGRLEQLDVEGCYIDDEGAGYLCSCLGTSRLLNLNLADNYIGDEGATAVAGVLATHEELENLELQNNYIKDEGATALANALKRNFEIEVVNLCGNLIGTAGAMKLRASAGDVIVLDQYVPTPDVGDVTPINRVLSQQPATDDEVLESAATPKQGPDKISKFLANATRMIEMEEKGMKDMAL